MSRRAIDVAALQDSAFGHKGLIWWGTVGFMVIEGTMFLIVFVAYFYLRLKVDQWPPSLPEPDLTPGTINLIWLFASCVPNQLAKWAAERCDARGVRLWLTVLTLMSIVSVVIRAFEYPALNCRWDDNAYGSIVWVVLSSHTLHLATDATDSVVLLAVAFWKPLSRKRFVDFAENSLYWYFIVLSSVPVYLIVYFGARWL